jgi:ComF family protein
MLANIKLLDRPFLFPVNVSQMTRVLDPLLSLTYPQACGVCGDIADCRGLGAACGRCWGATRIFDGNETLCRKCGAFLRETPGEPADCGRCTGHLYDSAFAIGIYEGALAANVLQLKHVPKIPKHLLSLCENRLDVVSVTADIVIPIPLSKKRLAERGYNQAELIASRVASCVRGRLNTGALRRKMHVNRNRAMMDRKARDLTVRDAFEVAHPDEVKGMSILLVDDVLTSGATASYCAKILKKNGAASVTVFTLARAV